MHLNNITWKTAAAGAAMVAALTAGATVLAQNVAGYGDGAGVPLPLGRGEATPVNTLTYQGRLTNPLGQPVSNTVTVMFRLMNDAGGAVYTTTAKSITPDAAGLFTTAIGDANDVPIPRITLDSASAVQVVINGNPLTPTQPLNSLLGSSTFGTGVVGRSGTVGVAGSASGPSGWGVFGVSDAPGAIGVRGKSDNGTGVVAFSSSGFAIEAQGNIKQDRDKGGALKAALDTATNRCFNGQTTGASVSTGTCGFTVTRPSAGLIKVNFGFQVNDRFVQVTPVLVDSAAGIAQIAGFDGANTVIIKTWTLGSGGPTAADMQVVISVH